MFLKTVDLAHYPPFAPKADRHTQGVDKNEHHHDTYFLRDNKANQRKYEEANRNDAVKRVKRSVSGLSSKPIHLGARSGTRTRALLLDRELR
jgi:hypothetical protein